MIKEDFLNSIPLFSSLQPEDHLVLVSLWKPVTFAAGDVIFRKGDRGSSMYVIEEGKVEITVPLETQQSELRVSLLHEADFFGELSLLSDVPRSATAKAIEPTRLMEMKRDDFIAFLKERPVIAISMVNEVGKRLQSTNELVATLASKNLNLELEEQLSVGDKLADKIAEFGGSWKFIISFGVFLFLWMILNSIQAIWHPVDPFPFIFLNLVLSCVAALQAPVIMMSQNRAQKKDRLRAELDYQVNLKSELMLQELHLKLDELRADELHTISEQLEKPRNTIEKKKPAVKKKSR